MPTVFFAALDRGSVSPGSGSTSGLPASFVPLVSDGVRRDILRMSRGISIMLLVMYVGISLSWYLDTVYLDADLRRIDILCPACGAMGWARRRTKQGATATATAAIP